MAETEQAPYVFNKDDPKPELVIIVDHDYEMCRYGWNVGWALSFHGEDVYDERGFDSPYQGINWKLCLYFNELTEDGKNIIDLYKKCNRVKSGLRLFMYQAATLLHKGVNFSDEDKKEIKDFANKMNY